MSTNMADGLKKGMHSRALIKKYTAWVLFGAIILVFVFFGISGKMSQISVGSAARVNDQFISLADYLSEEQRIQQYYSSMFGGKIDMDMQRQFIRSQAIESLVYNELSAQAAQRQGLDVSDAEVRDFIVNKLSFLQKEGRFQIDYYNRYLEILHSTPYEFENRVRKEIKNTRARQLIEAAAVPMNLETKMQEKLKSQQFNLAFIEFDQEQLPGTFSVTNEEIQAALGQPEFVKKAESYFEAHKDEFKISTDPKNGQAKAKDADGKAANETQAGPLFKDSKAMVAKKIIAKEKVDSILQNLEKAVAERNEEVIANQLKLLNKNWDETGFFDYSVSAIPKINSNQVLDIAFSLNLKQPLLNRMIREGNVRYLVKLKEIKNGTPAVLAEVDMKSVKPKSAQQKPMAPIIPSFAEESSLKRRAEGVFSAWIDGFKKVSKVEISPEILKR